VPRRAQELVFRAEIQPKGVAMSKSRTYRQLKNNAVEAPGGSVRWGRGGRTAGERAAAERGLHRGSERWVDGDGDQEREQVECQVAVQRVGGRAVFQLWCYREFYYYPMDGIFD
jgi:hypothetical protein